MNISFQKTYGVLFTLLAFSMPISVFITDCLIFLISALWIVEGNLKQKWYSIKSSKWMFSIIILFVFYWFGLLWGDFHQDAKWIIEKTALLLFLPILYSLKFCEKDLKNAITGFIISMSLSSFIALLINYNIIPRLTKVNDIFSNSYNISAFMSYNYHNLFLVFSIFLVVVSLFKLPFKKRNIFLLLSLVLMCFSLFTEAGRVGHVLFLVGAIFLTFHFFQKKPIGLIFTFALIASIFVLSIQYSDDFNRRVEETKENISNIETSNFNSISVRYNLWNYSLELIKKQPLLGYGTGSFSSQFSTLGPEISKNLEGQHKTPHNNFLYVFFELGIVGLFILLSIFYFQFKEYSKLSDRWIRSFFLILFLLSFFSDSYFQNHNSAILYVFISLVLCRYPSK